jgi:hypothetical protein
MTDTNKRRPPAAGMGRPKGAKNKIPRSLKETILASLDDAGGRAYLVQQAKENPNAYMALLGKVLPSDVQVSGFEGGPIGYAVIPEQAKSMEAWVQSVAVIQSASQDE